MKKHIFMLPFLGINAFIFAGLKFIVSDTGLAIFMLLFAMPILIFVSSIIYGKLYKFNIFYSILLTLIILWLSVTLYSSDLYIYAIIYGILALAWNAIGFAFHKESGNSKIWKIILWVFLTFLAIIMFLFALNIFTTKNFFGDLQNTIYQKNTVGFKITNLWEKNIENIQISTNEKWKCGLVTNTLESLKKDETKTLILDFNQKDKLSCNLASEGNYILTWEKDSEINLEWQENTYWFWYFTNYMPTESHFTIVFDKNWEIKINAKEVSETKEIKITKTNKLNKETKIVWKINLPNDAKHSISYSSKWEIIDYFVEYDAWEFEWDKSLSFDNKKASEARNKSLENFRKNWEASTGFQFEHKWEKEEYLLTPFSNFRLKAVYFEDWEKYVVQLWNKKIYETEKTRGAVREPFKNFVVDGSDWWLLYENMKSKMVLVHNGEIVENSETFSLTSIWGKTFYFFKKFKNSKIQFYLDWKIYDTKFDKIIHDKCCEPAAYNLSISNDWRLYFWWVIWEKFSYNHMLLPRFKLDFEKLKKEKTKIIKEKEDPKEILQNEIKKELEHIGFVFSEIIEWKTTPKPDMGIEKSFIIEASEVDEKKFWRDKNIFTENNWKSLKEFSWNASGVCSWQRVYEKWNINCLVRMQSLDCKKWNLWISCWDENLNNFY